MRLLFLALSSLLFISCVSKPQPGAVSSVTIKEIKPRYIEEKSFKRVREYLTGIEDTEKRMLLRSDRDVREGFYFVLILEEDVRRLPSGTTVLAEVYGAGSHDPQAFTFTIPVKRPKTNEIFVGLTGEDWPNENAVPAAWRFTLKDPNGETLGTARSYLWSL